MRNILKIVEPAIEHKNVVYQNRWSLVTGSVTFNIHVPVGEMWSLVTMVSRDRF